MSESVPPSEAQLLREQNTRLRSTVALMRTEMEALSQRLLPPARPGREAPDAQQPEAEAAAATTPGEQGTEGPTGPHPRA